MRKMIVAALLAGQAATAVPARAAELDGRGAEATERGAFAGARLRVPLGGRAGDEARAGLTLAPALHDERGRLMLGEGLEFGVAGRDGPALRLAGRRLDRAGAGPRAGVSTLGAIAIGAGVVALGFTIWLVDAANKNTE